MPVKLGDLPLSKRRALKLANQKPTIKSLDFMVREIVRARDKMKCRRCQRTDALQVAHVYSRAKRSVRWDLDNLFLLCANCHMNFAHKDPIGFAEWVRGQLGKRAYEQLKMRAVAVSKVDLSLVEIMLKQDGGIYEKE